MVGKSKKGSRGIRRGQWYRLVFQFPIREHLILIDELDLLLHDEALKKLIDVISTHAEDKNKQIIFTTHREMVTNLSDKINIRHIVNIQGRSYSFEETKPDAIKQINR